MWTVRKGCRHKVLIPMGIGQVVGLGHLIKWFPVRIIVYAKHIRWERSTFIGLLVPRSKKPMDQRPKKKKEKHRALITKSTNQHLSAFLNISNLGLIFN